MTDKTMKLSKILDEINKKHIGDIKSKEVLFFAMIGRLVKGKKAYSFNNLVSAVSSAGKDHLVSSVLKLFPREDYEIFGRISATALNYLHTLDNEPEYTYDGKILFLKEITSPILNNEVMKEFTSGEEEISTVVITKQKGGGILTKQIRGHPIVIVTTANTIPSEEIRNRFNIIKCDESEEQTKMARMIAEEEYSKDVLKFIAGLKSYEVEIPPKLYDFINKIFPCHKVRFRRDFPRFLDFVKTVTLFYQNDRIGKSLGVIRAEPSDYNLAKDIFLNAYSTVSDILLKDIDRRIVDLLEKVDKPIQAREIVDMMGGIITIQGIYPHLADLTSKEILQEFTERIVGHTSTTYALSEEMKDKKPFKLPNYD